MLPNHLAYCQLVSIATARATKSVSNKEKQHLCEGVVVKSSGCRTEAATNGPADNGQIRPPKSRQRTTELDGWTLRQVLVMLVDALRSGGLLRHSIAELLRTSPTIICRSSAPPTGLHVETFHHFAAVD
jgi:transposase